MCKGRGKEGEEGAEDEGGAHCGQCLEGQDGERDEERGFGARPLDHLQLSAVESRQKLCVCGQARHSFSSWHRGVGICRVVPEREIIR